MNKSRSGLCGGVNKNILNRYLGFTECKTRRNHGVDKTIPKQEPDTTHHAQQLDFLFAGFSVFLLTLVAGLTFIAIRSNIS